MATSGNVRRPALRSARSRSHPRGKARTNAIADGHETRAWTGKNNTLGLIKWEQMVFLGNPEYGCELHPIDFVAFAHACGGTGFRIEDPADCGPVLDQALAASGPVVVEAIVDPFTPPLPPKVTVNQAARFAESLARGEPHRGRIALTVLGGKVRELL